MLHVWQESKYSAPHFYLQADVRGEALLSSRSSINSGLDKKLSVNAFIIKLAAEALKRYPRVKRVMGRGFHKGIRLG